MQHYSVKLYKPTDKTIWDNFVLNNSISFLFQRDFMDYHNDRFKDFSLMIYKDESLVVLFPANKDEDCVHSHQGLTYGDLILNKALDKETIKFIYKVILAFLEDNDIKELRIKSLPTFYANDRVEMLNLTKELLNAKLYRKDQVLAIDYNVPYTIHKTKLKNYRKNQQKGFVIHEVDDFSVFWNKVLTPRLLEKHNTKPVHSLEEIELLNTRFPDKIRQFNIYLEGEILAGITIFDKGKVVKSQYGATTNRGEKERALEYLFLHLIYKYKDLGKEFFSMGTVTDNNELGYNKGLLKQKQELGCSIYFQDFYVLKVL